MPPIVLKIKGNESFLPFSNLDQEELSKTWRVCTKVKDSLENGSRLENLSWRLWFIQNVLVSSDVKSKTKFKKWSSSTTKKMETEKELEPTSNVYNDSTTTSTFISPQLPQQQQQMVIDEEQQKSVLDYSLNEIKPVGTENFVLNQFTSDQQGDQMIELKDIFPFGMQDFMYTEPAVSDNQINSSSSYAYDNTSSWPQSNIADNSTYYNNGVQQYSSYTPNISPPVSNNLNYGQQDFLADPISGIHSLFADHLEFPSLTIPANTNDENMTHPQEQHQPSNLVVDFNNAAYVAAAAAATAAALTTLPNATLHNKLLATLPRQTLASAERLLSPANTKRPSIIAQTQYQKQKMTESLPQSSLGGGGRIDIANAKKQKQQHYFSTFQLNTGNTPTTNTKKYVQQQQQQQQQQQEYHRSNHSSGQNSPTEEKPPICSNCEATSTPLWRRSADDKVLCNACGLYLKLHNAPRPKHLKPSHGKNKEEGENALDSEDKEGGSAQPQITCTNCGTGKTPLWRRDAAGKALCNACGLYFKLHNENRPLSMKTDVIKKRQRAETLLSSTDSSETTTDGNKKPRYYDQQSLYSTENNNGNTLGYRQSSSSLPGTGILMMTPSTTGTSSPT